MRNGMALWKCTFALRERRGSCWLRPFSTIAAWRNGVEGGKGESRHVYLRGIHHAVFPPSFAARIDQCDRNRPAAGMNRSLFAKGGSKAPLPPSDTALKWRRRWLLPKQTPRSPFGKNGRVPPPSLPTEKGRREHNSELESTIELEPLLFPSPLPSGLTEAEEILKANTLGTKDEKGRDRKTLGEGRKKKVGGSPSTATVKFFLQQKGGREGRAAANLPGILYAFYYYVYQKRKRDVGSIFLSSIPPFFGFSLLSLLCLKLTSPRTSPLPPAPPSDHSSSPLSPTTRL